MIPLRLGRDDSFMTVFEVVSSTRRSVRRSVSLPCEVLSVEGSLARERVLDLSSRGARVTARSKVRVDEPIVVSFRPPRLSASLDVLARVAHAESRISREFGDIDFVGLEFVDLAASARRDLERSLRGLPPPLPRVRRESKLVWLDVEMTWEENLDDQRNVFTTTERLTAVDDGEELVEVVAPPLAVRLPVHVRASGRVCANARR